MLRSKIFFSSVEHHWPLARRAESWLSCLDLPAATTSDVGLPQRLQAPRRKRWTRRHNGLCKMEHQSTGNRQGRKKMNYKLVLAITGAIATMLSVGRFFANAGELEASWSSCASVVQGRCAGRLRKSPIDIEPGPQKWEIHWFIHSPRIETSAGEWRASSSVGSPPYRMYGGVPTGTTEVRSATLRSGCLGYLAIPRPKWPAQLVIFTHAKSNHTNWRI